MEDKKPYDCETCPYPSYRSSKLIFCGVCIRKLLDELKLMEHLKSQQDRDAR